MGMSSPAKGGRGGKGALCARPLSQKVERFVAIMILLCFESFHEAIVRPADHVIRSLVMWCDSRGKPSTTTLPSLLKAVQPNLKLILVLRSPIDRMYISYMNHACSGSMTPASPHAPAPPSPHAFHQVVQVCC